jgi:predicted DNA-binding transcriptional regulator AlpA
MIIQEAQRRLRTPDAAAYVGLSPSTMEKMRIKGGGPVYEKSGAKIVVYRLADLEAWLTSRRRTSTSDMGEAA